MNNPYMDHIFQCRMTARPRLCVCLVAAGAVLAVPLEAKDRAPMADTADLHAGEPCLSQRRRGHPRF